MKEEFKISDILSNSDNFKKFVGRIYSTGDKYGLYKFDWFNDLLNSISSGDYSNFVNTLIINLEELIRYDILVYDSNKTKSKTLSAFDRGLLNKFAVDNNWYKVIDNLLANKDYQENFMEGIKSEDYESNISGLIEFFSENSEKVQELLRSVVKAKSFESDYDKQLSAIKKTIKQNNFSEFMRLFFVNFPVFIEENLINIPEDISQEEYEYVDAIASEAFEPEGIDKCYELASIISDIPEAKTIFNYNAKLNYPY